MNPAADHSAGDGQEEYPASKAEDPPPNLHVMCGSIHGSLDLVAFTVVQIDPRTGCIISQAMTPPEFERLAGLGLSRKWRATIKAFDSVQQRATHSLSEWALLKGFKLPSTIKPVWFRDKPDQEPQSSSLEPDNYLLEPPSTIPSAPAAGLLTAYDGGYQETATALAATGPAAAQCGRQRCQHAALQPVRPGLQAAQQLAAMQHLPTSSATTWEQQASPSSDGRDYCGELSCCADLAGCQANHPSLPQPSAVLRSAGLCGLSSPSGNKRPPAPHHPQHQHQPPPQQQQLQLLGPPSKRRSATPIAVPAAAAAAAAGMSRPGSFPHVHSWAQFDNVMQDLSPLASLAAGRFDPFHCGGPTGGSLHLDNPRLPAASSEAATASAGAAGAGGGAGGAGAGLSQHPLLTGRLSLDFEDILHMPCMAAGALASSTLGPGQYPHSGPADAGRLSAGPLADPEAAAAAAAAGGAAHLQSCSRSCSDVLLCSLRPTSSSSAAALLLPPAPLHGPFPVQPPPTLPLAPTARPISPSGVHSAPLHGQASPPLAPAAAIPATPAVEALVARVHQLGGCEMISRCGSWRLVAELLGLHRSQALQVMRAYFSYLESLAEGDVGDVSMAAHHAAAAGLRLPGAGASRPPGAGLVGPQYCAAGSTGLAPHSAATTGLHLPGAAGTRHGEGAGLLGGESSAAGNGALPGLPTEAAAAPPAAAAAGAVRCRLALPPGSAQYLGGPAEGPGGAAGLLTQGPGNEAHGTGAASMPAAGHGGGHRHKLREGQQAGQGSQQHQAQQRSPGSRPPSAAAAAAGAAGGGPAGGAAGAAGTAGQAKLPSLDALLCASDAWC